VKIGEFRSLQSSDRGRLKSKSKKGKTPKRRGTVMGEPPKNQTTVVTGRGLVSIRLRFVGRRKGRQKGFLKGRRGAGKGNVREALAEKQPTKTRI